MVCQPASSLSEPHNTALTARPDNNDICLLLFIYSMVGPHQGAKTASLPASWASTQRWQHATDNDDIGLLFLFLFILWWASLPAPCQSLTTQGWQHVTDNDDICFLFFFLFILWWASLPVPCQSLTTQGWQHVTDNQIYSPLCLSSYSTIQKYCNAN